MALSPTEKQRRYRASLKKKQEQAPDLAGSYLKGSIADRYGHSFDFEDPLEGLGYQNLAHFGDETPTYDPGEATISWSGSPALERLTRLAGVFLDAARELHEFINAYKVDELNARIAELEADTATAPEIKALAIERLTDIRARLQKEFRRSYPEIAVKGE